MQTANAFACRSPSEWPGALGWFTNRLLLVGAAIELASAAAFLAIRGRRGLEHRPPPVAGWVAALLSAPAVLAAHAAHKGLAPSTCVARGTSSVNDAEAVTGRISRGGEVALGCTVPTA